jgi:Hemerythrin HHE cation binding domain
MTLLDKVIAAVTPSEDSDKNREARARAREAAGSSGWLAMVLEHHIAIEAAFDAVRSAPSATARKAAQKWLATLLTAHSIAEEAVLYPALANTDQKGHATEMYTEQSATKVQMAALDDLEPMSQDYLDKLEHIRGAVAHHVAEEEGEYFLELKQTAGSVLNGKLTRLYREEFERYMGGATQRQAA